MNIYLYLFSPPPSSGCILLHKAKALESIHLLISIATGGGGCMYGLSDYGVIKAEAQDV